MIIKRMVLVVLLAYVSIAGVILVSGLFFGDPDPETDSAQSLVNLHDRATSTIADLTNEQVAENSQNAKDTKTKTVTTKPSSNTNTSTSTQNTTQPNTSNQNTQPQTSQPKPACGQGGTCTAAQVAQHSTQGDCWVIYGGKVYNVTAYANAHPGGAGAFDSSTCGGDITAQIQGAASSSSLGGRTKNHSSGDLSALANYYVGDLSG